MHAPQTQASRDREPLRRAAAAPAARALGSTAQPTPPRAGPCARSGRRAAVLHSDLEPVPVRPTSTISQAGCYRLREGDPVDLRVSRRHGRVALSFLHEVGHFVDHQLGAALGPSWASGHHEAFRDWRAAAAELPSRAPAGTSRSRRRYFDSAKEVWARSYAQTVLTRSRIPCCKATCRVCSTATTCSSGRRRSSRRSPPSSSACSSG